MSTPDPRDTLRTMLAPLLARLSSADPRRGAALARELEEALPAEGPELQAIRAEVVRGLNAGWLTPRSAGGVQFGRVLKSSKATHGFTVDAVDMSGPGPGHTHPNGEIDLCFPLTEGARFDGQAATWVVYEPDSWHVPTVSGGRMAILYFLPGGAIRFEPRP